MCLRGREGEGKGVHVTKETGQGRPPPTESGAHAPTATATSRRERGGASVRGKRAQAPRLSSSLLRRRSAAVEVRAGPEARCSGRGVGRGFPHPPLVWAPWPEPPSAPCLAHRRPGLVPGPESEGEAVLTSRCGPLPQLRVQARPGSVGLGRTGRAHLSAPLPGAARLVATANFIASQKLQRCVRPGGERELEAEGTKQRPPGLLAPKFAGAGPFKSPALRRAHVSGPQEACVEPQLQRFRAKEGICPGPLTLVETEAQESAEGPEHWSPAVLDAMSC